MVGSPLKLSASPPRLERAPPALGQHSDEIARHYGFDPDGLRLEGAIR
jgi:crotonobetainyl-CoA:carnitine CoA-transferase CaiB-like acyl-CoA transferase